MKYVPFTARILLALILSFYQSIFLISSLKQVQAKDLKYTEYKGILTITATGRITCEPEIAWLYIGVVTKADTAQKAVSKNSEKTQKVIKALKKLGITKEDIKTVEYELIPVEERNKKGEIVRRYYAVVENLQITVRDLKKTGEVLDAVIKAGVNRVYNVNFGIQNESAILLRAKQEAVKEALKQAEVIAKTAGVTIKGIKAIYFERSINPLTMPGTKLYSATSVPIEAGSLEFSARVTIKFFISKPATP
jgi:uncharacterized protein YggE